MTPTMTAGAAGNTEITRWCSTCEEYAVPMNNGTCGFCDTVIDPPPECPAPLAHQPATPAPRQPMPPARKQRMTALQRANDTRMARAELRRDLRAGRVHIRQVLLEPPGYLETASVFDVLMMAPKYGRTKVNKALHRCAISPSNTIGGLTPRQRSELAGLIRT